MIHPEHAKLIPVTGTNDQPDMANAVEVQFNPATLRVSLSNTLAATPRNGSSRAAQYVDKSSSILAVELIFDTTYIDGEAERIYQDLARDQGRTLEAVQAGSDVRLLTKRIAERFLMPVGAGDRLQAPSRCLFQWGAFEFLGLVQSFDETLDFFSPEGRPLRATVALRLSEDRFQFRNREVAQAERETPTLSSTGAATGEAPQTGAASNSASGAGNGATLQSLAGSAGDWRDLALYNGVENPRLPAMATLAVPNLPAGAAIGGGLGAGLGVSARLTPPAFQFGASASLGTGIEGAFSTAAAKGGLTTSVRAAAGSGPSVSGSQGKTGVGFD